MFERVLLEFQFVGYHSEGPNICFLVEIAIDSLGSHILDGTNEGGNASLHGIFKDEFRKSIVSQLDMPFVCDQQIFRFQLAVHNALFMKVFDTYDDLSQDVPD